MRAPFRVLCAAAFSLALRQVPAGPPADAEPTRTGSGAGGPALRAGYGSSDITPPPGTPSAGYGARLGVGMSGTHDPLLAGALILASPAKTLVLLGVDSLGFDHEMVEEVRRGARAIPGLERAELHLGSSHTHSGGGAFMPQEGAVVLFGLYNPERRRQYIAATVEAVRHAAAALRPARLGVGYRQAPGLNRYRGKWPPKVATNPWLTLIKVAGDDDKPLAALFVYAAHPTTAPATNLEFSADFVGYARRAVETRLPGAGCIYLNGAQGDVSPAPPRAPSGPPASADPFAPCKRMGERLAEEVMLLWADTPVDPAPLIETATIPIVRPILPGASGLAIAIGEHRTEMNAICISGEHIFITIPGELSTIYDAQIQKWAEWLGYRHATILGLTDDAIGYIITPESYRHRTYEATVSFSGPDLGPFIESKAIELLHALEKEGLEKEGAFNGSRAPAPAGAGEKR